MTTLADLDVEALAHLMDEAACRSVLCKYPAGLDWLDADLLNSVFWPDANIDFGPIFYQGAAEGFIPFVIGLQARYPRRQHMLGNFLISVSGAAATAEAAAVNHVIGPGLDSDEWSSEFSWGRYLLKLAKRQGEWRMSSMVYLLETQQRFPYDPKTEIDGLNKADHLSPSHGHYIAR